MIKLAFALLILAGCPGNDRDHTATSTAPAAAVVPTQAAAPTDATVQDVILPADDAMPHDAGPL